MSERVLVDSWVVETANASRTIEIYTRCRRHDAGQRRPQPGDGHAVRER
jgi:hypothetical protein